jgi:hypothetical protein
MPGAAPMRVGKLSEDRRVRGPHRLPSLVPRAVDIVADRSLEYRIDCHHRHQSVDIVTIPGIGKCYEQLLE